MTCEAVRALLSAYIDGELLPQEKDQLERHLSDCSQCLRECHSLSQTRRILRSMPDYETPEEFVSELTDMAEEGYGFYNGQVAGNFFARFLKPALVLGVLLIGSIFGLLWFVKWSAHNNNSAVLAKKIQMPEESLRLIEEKIGFRPILPGQLPSGYTYDGVSLFTVKDKKIAHFRFSDGKNRFYLSQGKVKYIPLEFRTITLRDGREAHLSVDDKASILHWEDGDLHFTLMGEVPHQILIDTADTVK